MNTNNSNSTGIGSGLVNLGNTCYANAALQALAHAPELHHCLELLQHQHEHEHEHKHKHKHNSVDNNHDNVCVLCEVEKLLWEMMTPTASTSPSTPNTLLNQCLPMLAPEGTFRRGVQEDSHEFLRLLIDGMQNCVNKKEADKSNAFELREYPYQLFRGQILSTVKCSNCNQESSTQDPMEDLTLTITSNQITSIGAALDAYVKEETLEGYTCENCKQSNQAVKSSQLAQVPPVLTLHLKRFRYGSTKTGTNSSFSGTSTSASSNYYNTSSYGNSGKSGSSKIEGHIKYEEVLNLGPYMDKKNKAMFCRLFAVVVHTGKNSHSGHYFAYVKSLDKNEWWKMDDSIVRPVSKEEVLAAEAYMLFYNVIHHPLTNQLKQQLQKISSSFASHPTLTQVGLDGSSQLSSSTDNISSNRNHEAACRLPVVVQDKDKDDKSSLLGDEKKRNNGKRSLTVDDWFEQQQQQEQKRMKILLPSALLMKPLFHRINSWIVDKVEWTPDFFQKMNKHIHSNFDKKKNSRDDLDLVHGVSTLDVKGDDGCSEALRESLHSYLCRLLAKAK